MADLKHTMIDFICWYNNITPKTLVEKTGLAYYTIQVFLEGTSHSKKTASAIATSLNISIDSFYDTKTNTHKYYE